MTDVDIRALCKQVDSTYTHLQALNHKQETRWRKTQEKFQAVYILLNKNTETDRRTYEAIRGLRQEIAAIKEADSLKLEVINRLESHQLEKTKGIESQTKRQSTKVARTNTVIFIGIGLLFFLYLKQDIAAGQFADAILTLVSASSIALYGFHKVGDLNDNP